MDHEHNQRPRRGFTLIELLIVIGIIGFLAAAILVAVDPVKRIQDARDARRSSEANALLNAILNLQVDGHAYFPGDTTVSGGAPIVESASLAQVIVKSASGVGCNVPATAPSCPQLPSPYSLSTAAGVGCVAKLDVAVQAPGALTAVTGIAGNVNAGLHSYKVTFVTPIGETDAGTASTTVNPGVLSQINLSSIPVAPAVSGVTARRIYRTTSGDVQPWKLVATIPNNSATTYIDNVVDSSLGADAPTINTTGMVPTYIADLPTDPGTSVSLGSNLALGSTNTGYYIIRNPGSRRITVGACYGENNTAISVTR